MINRLEILDFDETAFKEKYRLFRVRKTDDTNFIREEGTFVISTYYETSSLFWILVPAKTTLGNIYSLFPEFHYAVNEVSSSELSEIALLSLLVNALANPELSFNNLNAMLYEIIDSKKDQKITLCYSVDRNNILECHVKTFSTVNDRTVKRMTYKTQKTLSEGKMTFYREDNGYMIRCGQEKGSYINRTFTNSKKNSMEYFSIDEYDNKAYMMNCLIHSLNRSFSEFIRLGFADVSYIRLTERKRVLKPTFEELIERLPEALILNVIDFCNRKEEITDILNGLKAKYTFSEKPMKDVLNLCVVKNKSEYEEEGEEDRYIKTDKMVIQHIEEGSLNETAIKQCILELIIKYEALTDQILSADLPGEWNFYETINKTPHVMKVKDNRIIDMSAVLTPSNLNEFAEKHEGSDMKMIEHEGKSIAFYSTNVRLLPDYDRFISQKKDFVTEKNGKKVNKARSRRNELFGELIDINRFEISGENYLSIGEMGYGMNKSIDNSPSTRLVEEDGLKVEDILSLFEPNICQLNRYAITPYPYKIMNEIYRMNGGVIND